MKYAFYLGCSAPVRGRHYELATRKVAQKLDIRLVDIDDFCCCGFPIKSVSWDTFFLLAARNLCIAEERGLNICTICSACTGVLTEVNRELKEDSELREWTNAKLKQLNHEFKGTVEVRHFARILYEDLGPEQIKEKIKIPLPGFRIASHYGCHYLKPSENYNDFDNSENPKSLDELIETTGSLPINYQNKKLCCGGAILALDEDLAHKLAKAKLDSVSSSEAEALCVICTFCCVMYDDNQGKINKKFNSEYDLPVLYYPQILGLALGFNAEELGFRMNRVKANSVINKLVEAHS